jgi:hypothetical protein
MGLNLNQRDLSPLFDLAEEYHFRTEAYDRTVCTGPIRHGGIMPITGEERSLVNRHARSVMQEMVCRAESIGFQPEAMHGIISQVGIDYSFHATSMLDSGYYYM